MCAHTRAHTHFYRDNNKLCLHVGNSISLMGSPSSLPTGITPPPAPRPSPLVQEDELLSNNLVPEHSNIVSTLQLIARAIPIIYRKLSFRFASFFCFVIVLFIVSLWDFFFRFFFHFVFGYCLQVDFRHKKWHCCEESWICTFMLI